MQDQKIKHILLSLILVLVTLTACGLRDLLINYSGDDSNQVEEQVRATLTAIALEKEMVTPTFSPTSTQESLPEPPPAVGVISGRLSYPSEFLPPLRVVAFDVDDLDQYYSTEVYSGGTYEIGVPAGTYFVLAYLIDPANLGVAPGLAGAYSAFVVCGLLATCEDHSLVPVTIPSGETVIDIDPGDWYSPADQWADWPTDPNQEETGAIRGNLGFPSEYIPPLRVVVFDVNSQNYYYVDTLLNQTEYEISSLPPGTYHVMAYVQDQGPEMVGGYSYFVTCGQMVNCTDHSLIEVFVYPGGVTDGVDPVDFYVQPDEAGWPEDPSQ